MSNETNEKLFDEQLPDYQFPMEELEALPVDTVGVTKQMYALRAINKKKEQIKKQMEESEAFYKARMEKLDRQFDFVKGNIHTFLNASNLHQIVTPAGVASISKGETWVWEDRKKIIEWCKANASHLVSKSEEDTISLTDLKAHIKATQIVPQEVVQIQEVVNLKTMLY